MKSHASDWRVGSKRNLIAEMAERGANKQECYSALRPLVESQTKPMVFSANVGGRREAKPIGEQLVELKNEIGRVYALLGMAQDSRFESEEIPAEEPTNEEQNEETEEQVNEDPVTAELNFFLRRVREIRKFCRDRSNNGDPIDNISMRPVQAAAKLIPAGIPANVLLIAMTMHWTPDTRRDAGIDDFDFNSRGQVEPHPAFVAVSKKVMKERKIDGAGKHILFGYLLLLVENGINVMLIGPAGTGKSHIAEQVADFMNVKYGEIGLGSGASRGDLLGRHTISQDKPWITSEYTSIYSGGGIINLEEIDRADPGVLITLNNSIAGNALYNSIDGERYQKSDAVCVMSTANTFGLGANRNYTSAERLDAATIDRFRMGRMYLPLDEDVEEDILHGRI